MAPELICVLAFTSVERPAWARRVRVASGGGWAVAEQIRAVAGDRLRRYAPEIRLSAAELNEVRHILGQMPIV
ncbi:hypothetical protein [Candidatus Mycobacterium methanotrophicum]|uniref:Growth inhibitor PemK n=1 Tax=Candidatus Mycobacterium methanotrophicum TaxID=2943498 RepID=A0ABY4QI86_9MYCO|nr:hypothetical protein [Candidatus Mycobacterium methanotrophicum]UQX10058.1 hypothetical protein M5I08_17830 [Candidatus Mycobacterium methanotrophicum]